MEQKETNSDFPAKKLARQLEFDFTSASTKKKVETQLSLQSQPQSRSRSQPIPASPPPVQLQHQLPLKSQGHVMPSLLQAQSPVQARPNQVLTSHQRIPHPVHKIPKQTMSLSG